MYTNGNQFSLNNRLYIGSYNIYRDRYYTGLTYVFGISKELFKIIDRNDQILKYRVLNKDFYNYIKRLDFVVSNYIINVNNIQELIVQRYFVYSIILKKYYLVLLKVYGKLSYSYYKKASTSWNISKSYSTQLLSEYYYNIAVKYNTLQLRNLHLSNFNINIPVTQYVKVYRQTQQNYPIILSELVKKNIKLYNDVIGKNFRICSNVDNSYHVLNSNYFNNDSIIKYCLGKGNNVNLKENLKLIILLLFINIEKSRINEIFYLIFNKLPITYTNELGNVCILIGIGGYQLSVIYSIGNSQLIRLYSLGFYHYYNHKNFINNVIILNNDVINLIHLFKKYSDDNILTVILFELITLTNYSNILSLKLNFNRSTDFYSILNLYKKISLLVVTDYENRISVIGQADSIDSLYNN